MTVPSKRSGMRLADQAAELVKMLKVAEKVIPVVAEQARLEMGELRGGLPETMCRHCGERRSAHLGTPSCPGYEGRGADYANDPPTHYSDPTGETVIAFRPAADGDCRPVQDLERIARWTADVQHLLASTKRLLNQAPAATLAVVDGRRPTDGRSADEHAQRRFVRALSGERCLVGQDHEDTDRFGPGELRRGLCDRHRKAFARWQLAAGAAISALDAGERLVRWQMSVFGSVHNPDATKGGPGGVYRDNLKEVA